MNRDHAYALIGMRDEEDAYQHIRSLRNAFSSATSNGCRSMSPDEAIEKSIEVIQTAFQHPTFLSQFPTVDAGHGIGHWMRDLFHSWRLVKLLGDRSPHHFPGVIAGALHDIGCIFVDRYTETASVIRHAEFGALFIHRLLGEAPFDRLITQEERHTIAIAIAAHTQYLKTTSVACADGVTREMTPYTHEEMMGTQANPAVWFARWTDRLDCSGPLFVGRHYLTLERTHTDFSSQGFQSVVFHEHMRPLLRPTAERTDGNTMLEHLRMFADSQTNASVYGRYDPPAMQILRDTYRERMIRIISTILDDTNPLVASRSTTSLTDQWHEWLVRAVEPSDVGKRSASILKSMFQEQPDSTQEPWLRGFQQTLNEFAAWSSDMRAFVQSLPQEARHLSLLHHHFIDTLTF